MYLCIYQISTPLFATRLLSQSGLQNHKTTTELKQLNSEVNTDLFLCCGGRGVMSFVDYLEWLCHYFITPCYPPWGDL